MNKKFYVLISILFMVITLSLIIIVSKMDSYNSIVVGIDMVFGAFLFIIIYSNYYNRDYKTVKYSINPDITYFREIPCQRDILQTYWLSYYCDNLKRRELLLGAFLLKWIIDKKITIDKNQKAITFYENMTFEYEYEYVIYDLLKKSSGDDYILRVNELVNWSRKNIQEIKNTLRYGLKMEEEILFNANLVTSTNNSHTEMVLSDTLNQNLNDMLGFKKYINDFTLIKLREMQEVHIWEYYLVFSYLLGIADTTDEELKVFIPEWDTINEAAMFFAEK